MSVIDGRMDEQTEGKKWINGTTKWKRWKNEYVFNVVFCGGYILIQTWEKFVENFIFLFLFVLEISVEENMKRTKCLFKTTCKCQRSYEYIQLLSCSNQGVVLLTKMLLGLSKSETLQKFWK